MFYCYSEANTKPINLLWMASTGGVIKYWKQFCAICFYLFIFIRHNFRFCNTTHSKTNEQQIIKKLCLEIFWWFDTNLWKLELVLSWRESSKSDFEWFFGHNFCPNDEMLSFGITHSQLMVRHVPFRVGWLVFH